jgi:hypothetical protein
MESREEAMRQRLTHLERVVHRWQVGGTLVIAVMVVGGLMGAMGKPNHEAPDEIRARAFVLVDYEGRPRMDLRVARQDNTHLVLMDREGLPRLSLNVLSQGGTDVVLRDQLGQPRAALSVLPDGRPGLSMYGPAGTTRVSLGVVPEDKTMLVLYDPRGQVRWFTPEMP